jgi:sec1 family domain-containing protein 1
MAAKANSLRDRQIASLKKILNLNDPVDQNDTDDLANGAASTSASLVTSEGEPIWKVLVFDDLGRDVISSVLRVSDLRALGITMHM